MSAKENLWYDVGIVKVTNMVVTHYYVPYDDNVIDVRQFYFYIQQGLNKNQTGLKVKLLSSSVF